LVSAVWPDGNGAEN